MNQKLYMAAPRGTDSATIEGHEYEFEQDSQGVNMVRVISETHIETLKRHGFEEHTPSGSIDPDDMTPEQLVEFLEERGESVPKSDKKLLKKVKELLAADEDE